MKKRRFVLPAATIFLASLLVSVLPFSEPVEAKGRAGRGAATGVFVAGQVTREMCIEQKQAGPGEFVCSESAAASLDSKKPAILELEGRAAAIEAELNAYPLNQYSQASVDAYNRIVDRHDSVVDAHGRLVDTYNAELSSSCEPITSYCENLYGNVTSYEGTSGSTTSEEGEWDWLWGTLFLGGLGAYALRDRLISLFK